MKIYYLFLLNIFKCQLSFHFDFNMYFKTGSLYMSRVKIYAYLPILNVHFKFHKIYLNFNFHTCLSIKF